MASLPPYTRLAQDEDRISDGARSSSSLDCDHSHAPKLEEAEYAYAARNANEEYLDLERSFGREKRFKSALGRRLLIFGLMIYCLIATVFLIRGHQTGRVPTMKDLMTADQLTPHYAGARIGLVSVVIGKGARMGKRSVDEQNKATLTMYNDKIGQENASEPIDPYQLALQVRQQYCERWRYPLWIGTTGFVKGPEERRITPTYTKQAMALSVILDEIRKPEKERLEWIFFFDADTLFINHNVPLETFLPPNDEFGNSQVLIIARDPWGTMNSGAFAVRVSEVALKLLASTIALPTVVFPHARWVNGEQSSMIDSIASDTLSSNVSVVPSFWFNADSFALFDPHKFRKNWKKVYQYGDFMIHFMDQPKVMFTEMAQMVLAGTNATFAPPLNSTRYIMGDEAVASWYKKQAALPLSERQAIAHRGSTGHTFG